MKAAARPSMADGLGASIADFSRNVITNPTALLEERPIAGNVIEWCENADFLFSRESLEAGRSAKTGRFLYPEAYKILTDVFDLLCPYCNDVRALAELRADEREPKHEVLLRHGKCPTCTVHYLDILRARRAEDYEELALAIGMGSGKCLSLNTKLPTPYGFTTMGEVEVGDELFDERGKVCKVLAVHEIRYGRPCYKITFSDDSEVIADDEHLWVTWDQETLKNYRYRKEKGAAPFPDNWPTWSSSQTPSKFRKWTRSECDLLFDLRRQGAAFSLIAERLNRTVSAVKQRFRAGPDWEPTTCGVEVLPRTTQKIRETLDVWGNVKNHMIPCTKPLELPEADLPIHPYVLGYLLGDGDTAGTGRVACHPDDEPWVRAEFERCGYSTGDHADDRHFGVHGVHGAWKRLGLRDGKHVPDIYKRASFEQRLAVVQGLIDSDGYIFQGAYRFTNSSDRLGEDFRELVASLGAISCIFDRSGRPNPWKDVRNGSGRDIIENSFEISVGTPLPLSRMPRKLALARTGWGRGTGWGPGQASRRIVAVEPVESVPVRCIAVDSPSHLFLCGEGMIPTHNTYLAAEIATYQVHLLLGLSSVRRTYGLAHGAPIEMAFIASTAEQTKKTIWAYFKSFLLDSPWFKSWLAEQREIEKTQNLELVSLNTNDFKFHGPGFTCVSLNSNSGGLAGLRRIGGFLDELARFDLEGKRGANEVHQVIKASMQTFLNCYNRMLDRGVLPPVRPMLCSISSPIHEDDKIMRLGRESRAAGSPVYFRQLATWEFNPDYERSHFDAEFERDPARASRDYGAKPVGINQRLIQDPDSLERAVNVRRRPILEYDDVFFAEAGHLYVKPVLRSCIPDRMVPRFIALDPGLARDSFGIAIGHMENTFDASNYRIIFDAIIEIRPVPGLDGKPRREVHFESVTDFILDIRRALYIAGITTDHWNSAGLIQKIRSTGVKVDRQNVTFDDWELFGGDVMANRCEFPAREREEYNERDRDAPVTKTLHELKQMEYRNPKRIDHPENGSSDLAICCAGVHRLVTAGMFDDGSRPRRAQMPVGHGMHISQVHRMPRFRRIGTAFRLRRM